MTVTYPASDMRREWATEDALLAEAVDALKVPDGGFTYDLVTGQPITTGYAVSIYPDAEEILADATVGDLLAYTLRHADLLTKPGRVFGGWRDPDDGRVYLDVSVNVGQLDSALSLARKFDQLAVFDFAAGKSVRSY